MRGIGAAGVVPGREQPRPTGQAPQLPPLPATQVLGGDETGEQTGPEEIYSGAEAEFSTLQERAGQESVALRNILETEQDQQIKVRTQRMLQVMNRFSDVAGR